MVSWQILVSLAATFGMGIVAGAIPVIHGELVLIAAILAAPTQHVAMTIALVVAVALGEMVAKTGLYLVGRGVLKVSKEGKLRALSERYRAKMEQNKGAPTQLLFVSGTVGLPPFYVISILAGTFRVSYWRFLAVGTVARIIHFGVVALFPTLGRDLVEWIRQVV